VLDHAIDPYRTREGTTMDERTEQAFVDTLRKAAEAHREL
jgi:hypothetical protein